MRAAHDMDHGLKNLAAIISQFPPDNAHWNEAQNRFQFIDRLLIECLGWQNPNIKVENRDTGGGYADYVLGNPPKAIIEAKRESKTWNSLPTGGKNIVQKIKPILISSRDFNEAVHQVIPYCALRGAPIGIVCNGPQLAIFQSIALGYEPLEGDCYLFDGFSSYLDNFSLLWTLLSPEGITENRAFRDLSKYRNPRIPPKASQVISEPHRYRYRDSLQEELQSLSSLLLEDIGDNPAFKSAFYKECYVPIEANNRHLLLSKQIIGSRYKRVGGIGIVSTSIDSTVKVRQLGDEIFSSPTSKPVVVIGDVGVGKTSFFENLYIHMEDADKSDTYFITIDLGIKANLSSSIKSFILKAIPDTLNSSYGVDIFSNDFVVSVYHEQIKAFDRSVDGQLKDINTTEYHLAKIRFLNGLKSLEDSHLHASLGHIVKGRKKRVILVLDNADQRNFDVQQEAFLISQELAATRNLFVFVALRPSTFYVSKTTGALSAYQNKILTISPPPADEVVQRRIAFALRVAEGKVAPAALEGIRLNLENIALFLRATLRSIKTNEQIRQFLSNITGGNTRAIIELISSFCGSPNVDAKKIVDIEERSGNYLVPIHEFTKHALLGEYAYYNPQSSLVAFNLFDVTEADPREHFLSTLIIAHISSNLGNRDNDGFVSGNLIMQEMSQQGFIEEQVTRCLSRLASKKLIETPHSHFKEIKIDESENPLHLHYRATSIGLYHIRHWMGSFSYLDATSTDTPVFDSDPREAICEKAASFDIADRFTKTKTFRDYLESKWHSSSFNASYYDFPAVLASQRNSFDLVERVVTNPKRGFWPKWQK